MPDERLCRTCGRVYNFTGTSPTDWGLCRYCLEERQKRRERECLRCGSGWSLWTGNTVVILNDYGLCRSCSNGFPRQPTGRLPTQPAIQDIPRPKIQDTPLPRPTNIQNRKLRLE